MIGEGLYFGNKDSGVALVPEKNLRRTILIQSMDRKSVFTMQLNGGKTGVCRLRWRELRFGAMSS